MSVGVMNTGLTELKGVRVGMLVVTQRLRSARGKRPKWRCLCDCGTYVTVNHNRLIDKNSPKTHCGCKLKTATSGMKKEYHAWWDAKNRCMNPDHPSYPSYGGSPAKIRMCQEWVDSFEQFLKDVGPAPEPKKDYSLDRINAFGNYEPTNVRWATIEVQARNKKGTKWVHDFRPGKNKAPIKAAQLAEDMKLTYQQLRARMIDMGKWDEYVEPA